MRLEDDLFQELERFRERMERTWQQLVGPPAPSRFCPPVFEPPTDIYETEEEVVVVLEVAGIRDREVEVVVDGRLLAVRGEREMPQAPQGRVYYQIEVCYGPFQREVTLPTDVDPEGAQVRYRDGFLEVHLPKVRRRPSQRVRITVR